MATSFLQGFSGTVQIDGYPGQNTLARPERDGDERIATMVKSSAQRLLRRQRERMAHDRGPRAVDKHQNEFTVPSRKQGSRKHGLTVIPATP